MVLASLFGFLSTLSFLAFFTKMARARGGNEKRFEDRKTIDFVDFTYLGQRATITATMYDATGAVAAVALNPHAALVLAAGCSMQRCGCADQVFGRKYQARPRN
jgi:hypothetical protein